MDPVWVGVVGTLGGAVAGGWFGLWGAKVAAASAKILQAERQNFERESELRRTRLNRLEQLYIELHAWKILIGSVLIIDLHWFHGLISTEQRRDRNLELLERGHADFSRIQMMLDIHLIQESALAIALQEAGRGALAVAEDEAHRLRKMGSVMVKGDVQQLMAASSSFNALAEQLLAVIAADARTATARQQSAGETPQSLAERLGMAWAAMRRRH